MPRKPRRSVQRKASEAWMVEMLLLGYYTLPSGKKSIMRGLMFGEPSLPAWSEVEAELLPQFIKDFPCRRPWGWWQEAEPRRRVGGTELRSEFNSFSFGLPGATWWRDVDPTDPPRYESEAAYLQRHGLLTAAEKRYLAENPSLLDPVEIEYEIAVNPDVHAVHCGPSKWVR
jgi:hypothetical protein